MGIKKVFKPIENFVKKMARNILAQELLQTELRHENKINDIREDFRRHMQLLFSPTILISRNKDSYNGSTVIYEAKFAVPLDLNIPVPKSEMAVSCKLIERCPDANFYINDLTEKLFEDMKTRAKYHISY